MTPVEEILNDRMMWVSAGGSLNGFLNPISKGQEVDPDLLLGAEFGLPSFIVGYKSISAVRAFLGPGITVVHMHRNVVDTVQHGSDSVGRKFLPSHPRADFAHEKKNVNHTVSSPPRLIRLKTPRPRYPDLNRLSSSSRGLFRHIFREGRLSPKGLA
jgi:hypothetical protein